MGLFDGTPLERPVVCDQCGSDVKQCNCACRDEPDVEPEVDPGKQRLQLAIEKRKRGKVVTVIRGLRGSAAQRQNLLSQLKTSIGSGGTVDGDMLELQGAHLGSTPERTSTLRISGAINAPSGFGLITSPVRPMN